MRTTLLIAALLVSSTLTAASPISTPKEVGACGILDITQVIAVGQKIIEDITGTGEIPQADLTQLIQTLVRVADDCLDAHLKEPGSACYADAYAAEQAIGKLEQDVIDGQSAFVIVADIIQVVTKLRAVGSDCIVPEEVNALKELSVLN